MSDIKLYGYATSPFVRKAGCCLFRKGLDFEFVAVNPTDPMATLAFSDGTQVPVVSVGEDWKRDSTPIALWLDELFPDAPRLVPADPAARETVMKIEDWVSGTFLPSIFRPAIDGATTLQARFRFWRLAALVSAHTPLPEYARHKWPDFVNAAPFIQRMGEDMDLSEPLEAMQARIAGELVQHLGDGPFLGGMDQPTLVDLSVFPNLVFGYMAGLEESLSIAQVAPLRPWLKRMAAHLPANPILIHDDFILRQLSEAGL